MKRYAVLGIALILAGTLPAVADDNLAGLNTPNGKLVHDFLDLWFNQHKPAEAFDKYVSRDHYMDHAVYSGSTKKPQSFEEEKAAESKMMLSPNVQFIFKQVIVEGELVVCHILVQHGQAPYGAEMVEIERVRDGKIIDHWDIHEPLKEDSTVFVGIDR